MEIREVGSPYYGRSAVVLGREQEAKWSLPPPPNGHVHLILSTLQTVTVPIESCVHELSRSNALLAVEPEVLRAGFGTRAIGTLGYYACHEDSPRNAERLWAWRRHGWRTVDADPTKGVSQPPRRSRRRKATAISI